MGNKMDIKPIKGLIEFPEFRHYSEMPFEERLVKFSDLRKKRRELGIEISEMGLHISCLASMSDIAESIVLEDKIATSILCDLQKEGDVELGNLDERYDDQRMGLISYYFELFENAGFAKKDDTHLRLTKSPRTISEIFQSFSHYSDMPFEERLEELSGLKERKKNLEGEVSKIDNGILFLEYMPDIAEYRILGDETATILLLLLRELQEKDGIFYVELMTANKNDNLMMHHYLQKLQLGGFVELGDNINLTEKGRNFEYDGRFENDG
jgi:hypothetical protein